MGAFIPHFEAVIGPEKMWYQVCQLCWTLMFAEYEGFLHDIASIFIALLSTIVNINV